jgi:hypothetical protein
MVSNKTPKTLPLQITGSKCASGQFRFTFPTVLGNTYRVEQSANPSGPWTLIPGSIPGTGGDETYAVPMLGDKGFIRLRKQP